jgi:hypothetical protein
MQSQLLEAQAAALDAAVAAEGAVAEAEALRSER